MKAVATNHLMLKGGCRAALLLVTGTLLVAQISFAQPLELATGTTTTVPISSTSNDCSVEENISTNTGQVLTPWDPTTGCDADPTSEPALKVYAFSALSSGFITIGSTDTSFQDLSSTAKLSRSFTIPLPSEGEYSSTLKAQIATEVNWSGGFVAAGVDSTYAQIKASLLIRDITNATSTNPGPVVASQTFLQERFDSKLDLPSDINTCSGGDEDFDGDGVDNDVDNCEFTSNPNQEDDDNDNVGDACEEGEDGEDDFCIPVGGLLELLNLIDAVSVGNSTGTDVTAYLERGRTYAVEVVVKCDASAPVLGFSFCLFSKDVLTDIFQSDTTNPLATVVADDGFQIAPIRITVDTDPLEDASTEILFGGGAARQCDDGVFCTAEAFDAAGACTNTADDLLCGDAVACTVDTCSALDDCSNTPDDSLCEDNLSCTVDTCDSSAGCVFTPDNSQCADSVACTVDLCDLEEGCVNQPDDSLCDDAVACTVNTCSTDAGCEFTPDDGLCKPWERCDATADCQAVEGTIVFATSEDYPGGNLGGLTGADAKCTALANAAGLRGTTYRAWLSTDTVDAKDRINQSGPYINTQGNRVADDLDDLTDGTLLVGIVGDENGGGHNFEGIYTGTTDAGLYDGRGSCGNWTSNDASLITSLGSRGAEDSRWTINPAVGARCDGQIKVFDTTIPPQDISMGLYCFQDD